MPSIHDRFHLVSDFELAGDQLGHADEDAQAEEQEQAGGDPEFRVGQVVEMRVEEFHQADR